MQNLQEGKSDYQNEEQQKKQDSTEGKVQEDKYKNYKI